MSKAQDNVEKVRVSWGSDNDGTGSLLDADLLDSKSSEEFTQLLAETDCNLMLQAGMYSGLLSNVPAGANDVGVVVVAKALNETTTSQTYIDFLGKSFYRVGGENPLVWNAWYQLGSMTFDGTTLNILV